MAAVASIPVAAPVDEAALLRSIEKSSVPSMNPSSVNGRSITRSLIDAPSLGAV